MSESILTITPVEFELLQEVTSALADAVSHLEYCGYGDSWERECARDDGLPDRLASILEKSEKFLGKRDGQNVSS